MSVINDNIAHMAIPRWLADPIKEKLSHGNKGIILYGARQTGKTTLIREIIRDLGIKTLTINGDQNRFQDILISRDLAQIRSLTEGYKLLFIDEAQRIPEIGLALKIMLDNLPGLKLIITGSSSLDLASKISEPLTGRVWTYRLYPVAFVELRRLYNGVELNTQLEERLIYGSYPEIFSYTSLSARQEYLQNLSDAYLYKDLLELGGLKNSRKIRNLLKLVAFQTGNQVSLSELGTALEMGKDTVNRYLDFLEKSFVLFRLSGFNRNLRKEVTKMDKIYFYDLGIRNSIIDNLKPLGDRNDVGQLWENFCITERMKMTGYRQILCSHYFWRTYTGAEIDYVEERGGKLFGYEFKWREKQFSSPPKSWVSTYPGSSFTDISRKNYQKFVLELY